MTIDKFGRHTHSHSEFKFCYCEEDDFDEAYYVTQEQFKNYCESANKQLQKVVKRVHKLKIEKENINTTILDIKEEIKLLFKHLQIHDLNDKKK